MPKPAKIAIAVVLVVLVGLISWQLMAVLEPVYQGKPFSVWLEQYGTNHWSAGSGGELDKEAQAAIKQIGTNAIPRYLRMMSAREWPLKAKLLALIPKPWLARFHERSVYDYRILGAYGLIVLGEDAKPAVQPLIASLNDSDPDVRYPAVFALRSLGPVASEALPAMIKCLKDADGRVQSDAILGLGQIHQEPERVVPILIECLEKPQNPQHAAIIRGNALWSLGELGMQAKAAIPSLVKLLNEENPNFRWEVTNALRIIDPEAAAKAGVN